MVEKNIETAADIFSTIPPRRIWLGRVAGGATVASLFALIFSFMFAPALFTPLGGWLSILLIPLPFFIKFKPEFRPFDEGLLGLGVVGLLLFTLLSLAYFIEITHDLILVHFTQMLFYLSSLPFYIGDLKDFLYIICMFIVLCLIAFAPIWLIFFTSFAKIIFNFYRSRFFYWVLLLFPIFLMFIAAWQATLAPPVNSISAECFHDGKGC